MRKPKEKEEILVPKGLLKIEKSFEASCLMYWIMSWWHKDDWGWSTIHDTFFMKVTTDDLTRKTIRDWLKDNGYLQTRPPIQGVKAMSYRLLDTNDDLVPVPIPKWRIEKCWPYSTEDEEACRWYRSNLDLLERIPGVEQLEFGKTKDAKRQDSYMVQTLERKKGNIHRGQLNPKTGCQINRIYSPWCHASYRIRPLFGLYGQEMISLDLRASQVALLAARYRDEKLLIDCKEDQFYCGLFEHLKNKDVFRGFRPKGWKWGDPPFKPEERDDIKEPFFGWYFGKNPTNHSPKYVREIQLWMDEHYPKTASNVWQEKTGDHSKLSISLQNTEAEIFANGIYLDLKRLGVPSLLVHDAVYLGKQDEGKVREVADKHLEPVFGKNFYHLK